MLSHIIIGRSVLVPGQTRRSVKPAGSSHTHEEWLSFEQRCRHFRRAERCFVAMKQATA